MSVPREESGRRFIPLQRWRRWARHGLRDLGVGVAGGVGGAFGTAALHILSMVVR
jgi:hypothetical protein